MAVGRDGRRRYAPSPLCSGRLGRAPCWKSCEVFDGLYCCFACCIDIQRPPPGPIVSLSRGKSGCSVHRCKVRELEVGDPSVLAGLTSPRVWQLAGKNIMNMNTYNLQWRLIDTSEIFSLIQVVLVTSQDLHLLKNVLPLRQKDTQRAGNTKRLDTCNICCADPMVPDILKST